MADNIELLPGTGGAILATDDVAGVQFQKVKLDVGGDGATAPLSNSNPLPVADAGGSLTVDNGGTFAVQAAQSGVWNVTNVSGTVTLPTGASTAAKQPALGTAGTASTDVITVQGIAAMTPLQVGDNSASLTVDAPVATPVFVRLSDGSAAIATLPVSLATVPSHAVTNAGTFAVQAAQSGTWTFTGSGTPSAVSSVNSTTATLLAAAVFTGTSEDISAYASATISLISNVASATDGLSIQQSSDGTNWDLTDVYTVPAATGKTFGVQVAAKFFRVVYTNGGTNQASFRLQTIFHTVMPNASSVRPQDARTNDNDMQEMIGYLAGYNGTTWDRLRTIGTGILSMNVNAINAVTPLMGNGVTGTGSQRVTIASDNTAFSVNATVAGAAAHDAGISGNPTRVAGRARTSDYTSVANDDTADLLTTLNGKIVTQPFAIPELSWSYPAASGGITNTTGVTAKAAAAAGIRNYVTRAQIINGHATVDTDVQIRDGAAGTVLWRGFAKAAGGGVACDFDPPLKGTAATLIEVACGTTGTATYFNLQGYTGP